MKIALPLLSILLLIAVWFLPFQKQENIRSDRESNIIIRRGVPVGFPFIAQEILFSKKLTPIPPLLLPWNSSNLADTNLEMDVDENVNVEDKIDEKSPPPNPSFSIVLEPKERTVISSELNIPVVKIYKRMGDSFQPGELLMSLDSRISKGNYDKAFSKREKARLEWEGKKQLYKEDLISLFEVIDAEAAYADASSDFITAKKYLLSTKVKATYAGSVVKLGIEENELAQVGKELIELIRDDVLRGQFLAPVSLLSCLKMGTKLIVEVDGVKKDAAITRISPIIDPTSGTIKVETEINNAHKEWTPGQVGRVTLMCQKNA